MIKRRLSNRRRASCHSGQSKSIKAFNEMVWFATRIYTLVSDAKDVKSVDFSLWLTLLFKFTDNVKDTFVSHCQMTWLEAKATCDDLDSDIIDMSQNMYGFLNETITYWSSKVYTPWVGLVGRY